MPRLTEIQTDKPLYTVETPILGYLPEFDSGTRRALLTSVELAAVALSVTTGLKNFAVEDRGYYSRWGNIDDDILRERYYAQMAAQAKVEHSYAEAA